MGRVSLQIQLLSNQNIVNKWCFDELGLLVIEVLSTKNKVSEEMKCFFETLCHRFWYFMLKHSFFVCAFLFSF